MIDQEEEFFAWLDGELAPADAARVAARVAADPVMAREAQDHRAMTADLREAFDPVMTPRSEVVDLAARRTQRRRLIPESIGQWAAIAATLVAGIGLGTMVAGSDDNAASVRFEGSRMIAAASLDEALTSQLASVAGSREQTRIGLTFRNRDGGLCRSFSAPAASGVACRSGGAWIVEGLFDKGANGTGDYRMATGADPRAAALVEQMIAGGPFDAAGEAAAKQSGWR